MTVEHTGECEVDVCSSCGGVFIEWFDGDPSQVAQSVRRGDGPSGPLGQLRCPVCQVALEETGYPEPDSEARVYRCGECAGTFVHANGVAALGRAGAPDRASEAPSLWAWLGQKLARLSR